ncbi:CAP domain-containing protein [Staphylococcus massiliensis]|uniref:CAP domain-containing protein n=1 Tax=Staphylococcus massiliensis TaxID=555791 RepID=UPI00370D2047
MITIPTHSPKFMEDLYQKADHKIASMTSNTHDEPLKTPKEQPFAVRNIQLNMDKQTVEQKLGKPQRETRNEYGNKWYTYHNQYQGFVMVSYLDNKVHGLYTNQNIISSKNKIKYMTPKDVVRQRLGKPLDEIDKGKYRIVLNHDHDIFSKDGTYISAFYDKHRGNSLTGLLIVSKKLEHQLSDQYGSPSKSLKEGFELLNFDLVNAERVQHELPPLSYSGSVSQTARKHSQDMAKHNYFDHTSLKGLSPFDRLKNDGHDYNSAGENLAHGQNNSIVAHHGLMNSLGHRKNILEPSYQSLGVGVSFNDEKSPYWTENYTG